MGRRNRNGPRTPRQAAADRHASEVAGRLGRSLRDARKSSRLTQRQASEIAGLARSTWSGLERASDDGATLATWDRAALAVGARLDAFLRQASAADQPRDAVHLRHQELVIRTALAGGWRSLPEEPIDRDARTSRVADVVLRRKNEYAIVEIWDWFDDVGAALRDFDRRRSALERFAIAQMQGETLPRSAGCWLLRATQRNRRLVHQHQSLFHARFPAPVGSGWRHSRKRRSPCLASPRWCG